MATQLPDCQACGACCIAEEDQHYHAELSDEETDHGVFGPDGRYSNLVVSTQDYGDDGFGIATRRRKVTAGPLAGYQVCGCCFLQGDPLDKVQCKVYPDRPKVCRLFKRGSRFCLAAIQWLQDQADE